ncbi:MAG: polymerase sigma-70 factor, subfamily [Parcubacteria group bacterium]|nr:polymerase sigma-70 factor, subfamily [Parcubacteria group bacterium]
MKTLTVAEQFQEIYESELGAIYRFCLMRTSDPEVASDFSQDVFLRFWKALLDNQIIKNPRSFLYTIARNIIIDGYRKKKTLSLDAILSDAGDDKSAVASTHLDAIETECEAGRVTKGMEALDEPYRRALHMRYIEGLKPREIATILQESANVISVRISRGAERLRSSMGYANA